MKLTAALKAHLEDLEDVCFTEQRLIEVRACL